MLLRNVAEMLLGWEIRWSTRMGADENIGMEMKKVIERWWEIKMGKRKCRKKSLVKPIKTKMKDVLSECLGVNSELISIKATTTEKLGFVGKEEGVSSYATVLIQKNN